MRYARFLSFLAAVGFLEPLSMRSAGRIIDPTERRSADNRADLSGTRGLSTSDLARIKGTMVGWCFDENSEELQERIRALFQDKGHLDCQVDNVRIKTNDPLAVPKPISVEAVVLEGRRFKIGEIKFVGNHGFESSELEAKFSLKKGALFARNQIAGGLEGVRDLDLTKGFIEMVMVPDVVKSSEGAGRS